MNQYNGRLKNSFDHVAADIILKTLVINHKEAQKYMFSGPSVMAAEKIEYYYRSIVFIDTCG